MTDSGLLYLGRLFDVIQNKVQDKTLLYNPVDLTTHAIITGMTGSGKTGLGIIYLEEAALQGLPAIIIDPKGDLTNLLLHFPDLLPTDFEPWVDPDEARRAGKDVATFAADTAARWKTGLEKSGLGRDQLLALQKVDFSIYTPGSASGIPVNILSSFAAPSIPWQENSELLRERIASTVTGLLSLVGIEEIDPLRSREHILISNLLENAWSKAESIDMLELILRIQKPPIERLGAFPVDRFFPEQDRFELAMVLNNFLASPSFQTWQEGQPLDIGNLLFSPQGRPRHSIFYLAHLSEKERMFFVTLLFAAIEAWMRTQRGTGNLRTMIYFDEIMGYLPPVANPPSRVLLLRMLKQARAFGVGLVLATQNPVDVDYKALSNAGTWIIGRLQTERDKERLLEGLLSLGSVRDKGEYDKAISGLQKRVFLLHNVHEPEPVVFTTRWALNYLAGPLTRAQIPQLNQLAGKTQAVLTPAPTAQSQAVYNAPFKPAAPVAAARKEVGVAYSATRPAIPEGVAEYFLPNQVGVQEAGKAMGITTALQSEGFVYHPALLAQTQIRYFSQRYRIEYESHISAMVAEMAGRLVRWEDHPWSQVQTEELHKQALPQAKFKSLPELLSDPRTLKSLETDFVYFSYRTGTVHLHANETLKVYASPQVSIAEFREMCSSAAREKWAQQEKTLSAQYDKKIEQFTYKLDRQEQQVEEQSDELSQRRMEELGTHGELLLSMLGKQKRSVTKSLTKRRMTSQAKADLTQDKQELEVIKKQVQELEQEKQKALAEARDQWANAVNDISEIPLNPVKKDIFMELFGVMWLPYYLVRERENVKEIPAFVQKQT